MEKIRYLFDEDIPALLAKALRRKEPGIDIVSVGDANGPAKTTTDSELLEIVSRRIGFSSRVTRKRFRATWSVCIRMERTRRA